MKLNVSVSRKRKKEAKRRAWAKVDEEELSHIAKESHVESKRLEATPFKFGGEEWRRRRIEGGSGGVEQTVIGQGNGPDRAQRELALTKQHPAEDVMREEATVRSQEDGEPKVQEEKQRSEEGTREKAQEEKKWAEEATRKKEEIKHAMQGLKEIQGSDHFQSSLPVKELRSRRGSVTGSENLEGKPKRNSWRHSQRIVKLNS